MRFRSTSGLNDPFEVDTGILFPSKLLRPVDNQNDCAHSAFVTCQLPTTSLLRPQTAAAGAACFSIVAGSSQFCGISVANVLQVR